MCELTYPSAGSSLYSPLFRPCCWKTGIRKRQFCDAETIFRTRPPENNTAHDQTDRQIKERHADRLEYFLQVGHIHDSHLQDKSEQNCAQERFIAEKPGCEQGFTSGTYCQRVAHLRQGQRGEDHGLPGGVFSPKEP
jgi:hypothetical protein